MAFGSTPVGVGPGKPTTDSGGKTEELTTAVVAGQPSSQAIESRPTARRRIDIQAG